ncbi:DUF4347 domain-containing protein [Pseudomonas sp. Q1-7]|uniref:DUF4347 domain-containing protein n=1 Tax=Pseudomonas sp. Q1-7 TaxID=3020843 RepID=UPI00230024F8|nr:DUF4347 domain-containing protein [Pseudomonas sp. Q1-7]
MMFDGAVAATVADTAASQPTDTPDAQDSATSELSTHDGLAATPTAGTGDQRQEVVFIDNGVKDFQQLVAAIKPGTEVVVLDGSKDGLRQIADYLDGRSGLDAIHIISHGAEGQVLLGTSVLDMGSLQQRAGDLAAIGDALKADGDILLYGCDVAKGSGQTLIQQIANLTAADVAASSDATGSLAKGGDWALEARVGSVEAGSPWLAGTPDYDALLATVTLNSSWLNNAGDDWIYSDNQDAGNMAGTLDSIYLDVNTNAFNTPPVEFTIASSSGTAFNLDSITLRPFNDNNDFQFEIYPTGDYGAKVTSVLISNQSNQSIVITTNLLNITSFTIRFIDTGAFQGSPANMDFLSFTTSPANAAPTLGGVNGDIVDWAGVGGTVFLDDGANATLADAELGALNGGNGNWAGASLTLQRPGAAVAADVFGFDTAGALFTVSGSATSGELQANDMTFATYTSSGGVLIINFTSSATTATTALVNDVARHITYRNNTPAGDATVRYTLNDGTSSVTADATVTSNTIYITNTTDTATVNVSDGVSFSEAVAIAAADGTGTQTLIFGSGFTSSMSLAGNLAINESLTINADAASGLVISGSTITLGGGTTLNFTNSSGTVGIASTLAGSGALNKAGGGTLTLSSTGNEASMSGGITVSDGTLQVSNDDHLSSGTLTLNGGTLTNGASSFTIDNAVVLGAAGGTINVGGGGGAASLTLSGSVSGSGSLTKNGQAILQLNGDNGYSGATTLFAGTLIANHANALGTTAGGTAVSDGATLRIGGGLSIAENLSVSGSGKQVSAINYGALHLISGTSTLSGSVTLTGNADISAASGATLTLSGVLSGSSSLNKTDAGTLVLSNADNSGNASGGISVSAGTLSVASDAHLSSGTLTLNGGTLALTNTTTVDNAIVLAATSTVSASTSATLSGSLSGSGGLTKIGAGTLTLSGNNSYLGVTNVSVGGLTLQGGAALADSAAVTVGSGATLTLSSSETIGSLDGAGGVALGANTLTTGGDNTSTTFSGNFSGSGGLTKVGSGTLTLSGSNAYSGSTQVQAGGLTLSGGAAIADASSVSVSSGATLTLSASETLGALVGAGTVQLGSNTLTTGAANLSTTFSGSINGSGNLVKSGTGTLTLSGSNGYTGTTSVTGGGTLSITDASNISGNTLILGTAGVLQLTGGNVTLSNAFTLNTGGGVISNANALTLSGVVSGTAGLTKVGAGVLTLSNANTHAGTTTVSAGTLSLTGSTASATTVASGATLAGSGTLGGDVTVQSGGTLSPGISVGTLTVNGNLQMNAGSTLAVEINGTTAGIGHDQILVNGSVNVAGATLAITHGYAPGLGDSYVLVDNDGVDAIAGTFSGLAEGGTLTAGGNGTVLTASYAGGSGNDFTLTAPTNTAPVLGNLDGGGTHTEGGAPTVIDADVTVSDTELDQLNGGNGNYNGASLVLVRNGGANAQDVFGFSDGNGITRSGSQLIKNGQVIASFDTATSGQLTLTFSDAGGQVPTTADVTAVLRQITYASTSDAPPASVTLSWTFSDGAGGNSSSSAVVNLVGTNDAPVLAPSSPILTGLTDTDVNNPGQTVASFAGAGITDADSGALSGIAITGLNAGNGTWQYSLDGGASWQNVGVVSGSSALLLRGTDRVRFVPDGVNGTTASLTYRAWDQTGATSGQQGTKADASSSGGTTPFSLSSDTASLTVTAVNDAPVVSASGGSTSFVEGDNVASTPVVVDGGITVVDSDSPLLPSATVSITGNFISGQDVLGFTNNGATMGDISASYNSATGVLTLTSAGGASAAQWQAALRAVTYSNSSETPNTATRTISFAVSDGLATSSSATRGVTVTETNDAPVVNVPVSISLPEDTATALTGISFSDADAGSGTVTVTFSVASGSLAASSGGGVIVGGTTSALTLTGSIANINAFIAGANLSFTSATNAAGNVTLTVAINDNGLSGGAAKTDSDVLTLTVTAVNDAPTIVAPGSIGVTEDVAQPLTGISFADVDAGFAGVTVTLGVGSGSLAATSSGGVTVGGTASALTLTGSISDINAFIAGGGVSYLTASNAASDVTLSVTINDGGNTGTGGSLSASTTVTLSVTPVNDAPVNTVPATQTMQQDGVLTFSTGNGNAITISDLDAGGGSVRVTLTATNGLITLSGTVGLSFQVGDGTGDATMTFEGSIANINTALAGLAFTPTGGYFGPASLQITTDDLGLSGSGGNQTDSDTITVNVVQPNPTITGVSSSSPDGGYKVGDTINITVTFDQAVNVAGGLPTLLLETGLVDRTAIYVSGSGTNTLTFAYVVQAGDVSADLNYHSTAALVLNDASIASVSLGAPAVITLPVVGGGDSLADNAELVIDGIAPSVTSVEVPANGTYVAGQNLDFTVNLSEAVTVDTTGGMPRIAITLDGGGTVFAEYLSGSGATALVFRLTVSNGQFDTNGISVGGSIQANGGTLRDAVGNDLNPVLASVGNTSNIRVDAVVPTVASVSVPVGVPYNAGDTLTFVVNASEAIIVNGTPRLALDIGGTTVFADYVAGSGTNTLVFQYSVRPGDNDADGIAVNGLLTNGAVLQDAAGNTMNLTLNNIGGTSGVIVDTVAPFPSGIVAIDPSPTNAGSVRFTVTFSESVSGVSLSDFNLVGTGTAAGSLASLVQLDARTFQITVSGLSGTGTLGLNLNASGTGIIDQAGNAITGGLTGAVYSVDRDTPTVTGVSVPVGVAYNAGDSLTFVVNLSEVVTVSGSPRLALDIGGTTVFADYVAGSGTNTLVFQYSVRPGDNDADGIAVSSLLTNGASLRDATGNDLNLTLNGVGNTSGVIVDTTAPGVSATVAPLPTPGSVQYTVIFDENVSGVDLSDFNLITTGNVTGTLQSLVQVDARTFLVTISNVAGSGTLTLGLNTSGTLITDVAGNPQVSALSAQTYSVPQSDGDPEFRASPPVILPPEPTVPVDSVLPSPPPPPFTSPLIPPPLFEAPTLGSGIPTLGNIFINQGALAPSFIAQVFGSSDGFGDGSGAGFLGFGGGDGGVFGSSSLSSFFDKDVPQESGEMKLFDGKQWKGGSGGSGQGIFGAPTLGQQLQDIKDSEQRQVRALALALGQIQADRPQV